MNIKFLLFILILNSCASSKTTIKTGIKEILFGNGGGFTGEMKTYKISADNKIYENGKLIKTLLSKKTKTLFKKAKYLKQIKFNEPDNMYFFIEIISNDNGNRIVWGSNSKTVDKKVSEFYKELISTIK